MENAVEALKMSFAVFVFVMALSLTMTMFTKAKTTADVVLHSSDMLEFVEYDDFLRAGESFDSKKNRIVGLETIIPTLYKYRQENYTVIFRESNGTFMKLYESHTNLWNPGGNPGEAGYKNKYFPNDGNPTICSFDLNEEQSRHEPWVATPDYNKIFLDAFLSGGRFYYPSYASEAAAEAAGAYYQFDNFMEKYANTKFVETLGEYSYSSSEDGRAVNERKKRVIIYTKMP